MNLLSEEQRDTLIDSLDILDHKYNGIGYNVEMIRAGEDLPIDNPFVVVSFLPTNEKVAMSLNNFLAKRDNPYYNDFAYGEVEIVIIRAFCKDQDLIGGRELAQAWLQEMERYIKISWTSLINYGSVDLYSFSPYREIYSYLIEKQFGYEMSFKVITTNYWTDEPETGATSPVDIEETRVDDDNFHIWVRI